MLSSTMELNHYVNSLFGTNRRTSAPAEYWNRYLNVFKMASSKFGTVRDTRQQQQQHKSNQWQIRANSESSSGVKLSPIKQLRRKLFAHQSHNKRLTTSGGETLAESQQESNNNTNNHRQIIEMKTSNRLDINWSLDDCKKCTQIEQLFTNEHFLAKHFFVHFEPIDCCSLAQVCKLWKRHLYRHPRYWLDLIMAIDYDCLRRECTETTKTFQSSNNQNMSKFNGEFVSDNYTNFKIKSASIKICNTIGKVDSDRYSNNNKLPNRRISIGAPIWRTQSLSDAQNVDSTWDKRLMQLYKSFDDRNFQAICLLGANDEDIVDFVANLASQRLQAITYANITDSTLTDKGVLILVSALSNVRQFELSGCNAITNCVDFSPLRHMSKLCVTDCINIADGFVTRIYQVLAQLRELTIQSYHITDISMDYLQSQPNCANYNLRVLEMLNCKEISDETIIMIAGTFRKLESLSLSGCVKITDVGVELLTERAHHLRRLDIGWCSQITDSALESIACDLGDSLVELVIDRCSQVTDVGIEYVSTMSQLNVLSIRWCQQITDCGLETVTLMPNLTSLLLAGCNQITMRSIFCLIRSTKLTELELINCPSISYELITYLQRNLPNCSISS